VSTQAYLSFFKQHRGPISNARFTADGRLVLSSYDDTASIVSLSDQFHRVSGVRFQGHAYCVNDILRLPSWNQCVTGSEDKTIKVWDCQTGACLRTLTEHTSSVNSLEMHPNGHYFASGSYDQSVIIWSCKTFEVASRISFPNWAESLLLGGNDMLYAGVYGHGLMSCNVLTGEVGPVIISGPHCISGLALGKSPSWTTSSLTHTRNSTVPAPKPWTSSTHALWPLPAQHIVHMTVVVLWKVYKQHPHMYLPYELVEIIFRHVQ
jgi:WD40 repeat protein